MSKNTLDDTLFNTLLSPCPGDVKFILSNNIQCFLKQNCTAEFIAKDVHVFLQRLYQHDNDGLPWTNIHDLNRWFEIRMNQYRVLHRRFKKRIG